jgi:hypothetical protein
MRIHPTKLAHKYEVEITPVSKRPNVMKVSTMKGKKLNQEYLDIVLNMLILIE